MGRDSVSRDPSPGAYSTNSVLCPRRPRLTSYRFFCLYRISSEPEKTVLPENSEEQQQVVQRSRWQAVLLEAGGIGAAVSEESMRRLKYCLQWLQVGSDL